LPKEVTYWSYLKIEELLSLQKGLGGSDADLLPDEQFFIIIHQVYELWFKAILTELALVRSCLLGADPELAAIAAQRHIRRAADILEIGSAHWKLFETLSTPGFLEFRDKLFPASGFQSYQFPQIEIVLGLEEALKEVYGRDRTLDHISRLADTDEGAKIAWTHIQESRGQQTIRSVVRNWLAQYADSIFGADENVRTEFVQTYMAHVAAYHSMQIEKMARNPANELPALRESFVLRRKNATDFFNALDISEPNRPNVAKSRAALIFIESYLDNPRTELPRALVDSIVSLEHQFYAWRIQHASAAERVIGRRIGTGGSAGVDYLYEAAVPRVFTDLLTARTEVLPKEFLPAR
jgi:tryptophan 2,3-dioxygenase